jgi:hypothetical protein
VFSLPDDQRLDGDTTKAILRRGRPHSAAVLERRTRSFETPSDRVRGRFAPRSGDAARPGAAARVARAARCSRTDDTWAARHRSAGGRAVARVVALGGGAPTPRPHRRAAPSGLRGRAGHGQRRQRELRGPSRGSVASRKSVGVLPRPEAACCRGSRTLAGLSRPPGPATTILDRGEGRTLHRAVRKPGTKGAVITGDRPPAADLIDAPPVRLRPAG